jgi:hypothetical protein
MLTQAVHVNNEGRRTSSAALVRPADAGPLDKAANALTLALYV